MSINAFSTNPEQLEQEWLTRLEEKYREAITYLESITGDDVRLTFEQLKASLDYLQDLVNYIYTFNPMGFYLRDAGLPRLSERIVQFLFDLQGAYQTLVRKSQESSPASQSMSPSTSWINIMNENIERQGKIFEESQRLWRANFTQTCVHCGDFVGNSYFTRKECPNCGRLLHGGYM